MLIEYVKHKGPPSLLKSISLLTGVYALFRLVFYFYPKLKTLCFIHPTGKLVSLFWGMGKFYREEWVYEMGRMRVVLGELCSGTTFFSLLVAYMIMRYSVGRLSLWWIAASYPLSLFINAARVICSAYVSYPVIRYLPDHTHDHIHLAIGVIIFFTAFIVLTLFWEIDLDEPDRKHIPPLSS